MAGGRSGRPSVISIPLCPSPPKSTRSRSTHQRRPGAFSRFPSSHYLPLVPSFPPAIMSGIPDIILKNSDQRALSPKAVAFQVATMAGISVRQPASPRLTPRVFTLLL